MDLSRLNADDWAEFGAEFPSARAWLLHRSLAGELRLLRDHKASGTLNEWRARRLDELEELFRWHESFERGGA